MTAEQSNNPEQFKEIYGGYQFDTARRLYGRGPSGMEEMFKGRSDTLTPWPSIGKSKQHGLVTPEEHGRIQEEIRRQPPVIRNFDPRWLFASQPGIAQSHVRYYMSDDYAKTGKTSADQTLLSNQFPVILQRRTGRNVLLSGHHRATAALLRGTPLRGIAVEGD